MLAHVDLFSGIGGFSLAAGWAGFETVLHCEKDAYCRRVLERHWPHVPIAPDIHTLTGEIVRGHLRFDYRAAALSDPEQQGRDDWGGAETEREDNDDGRLTAPGRDGDERRLLPDSGPLGVDLLTGGFPCQPFSVAGRQRGKEDDRHLWPQMLRVIEEVRPRFVCAENVAGFIRMALDDVLADLEAAGYETGAVVLPACGVGAWHRRERVFVLAHTEDKRSHRAGHSWAGWTGFEDGGGDVPDATQHESRGLQQPGVPANACTDRDGRDGTAFWRIEPAVGRVADGVPRRVDRLRALGNAVVPQQVYPILAAIAQQSVLPLGACP